MASKFWEIGVLVNSVLFLIGFPIWAGIYLEIYHPLLSRNWKDESMCKVLDDFYYYFDGDGHEYYLYKVGFDIDGLGVEGYACFSDRYSDSIAIRAYDDSSNGTYYYPYSYARYRSASKILCLPRWLCSPLSEKSFFPKGRTVNCKWWLNDPSSESNPSKVTEGPPVEGSSFVEVMFKEKIYIPPGDFWCLMVLPLGLMSILTSCLNIFLCGPMALKSCIKREFTACKDFCCLKVIRNKNYTLKLAKTKPKLQEGSMASSMAFLYVYEELKHSDLRIKPRVLKKVIEKFS